jgi:hypothetical protein
MVMDPLEDKHLHDYKRLLRRYNSETETGHLMTQRYDKKKQNEQIISSVQLSLMLSSAIVTYELSSAVYGLLHTPVSNRFSSEIKYIL